MVCLGLRSLLRTRINIWISSRRMAVWPSRRYLVPSRAPALVDKSCNFKMSDSRFSSQADRGKRVRHTGRPGSANESFQTVLSNVLRTKESNTSSASLAKRMSISWTRLWRVRSDSSPRSEQGAAFMSDEYVRLTGKAGLCLSTLGPGGLKIKNVVFFGHPYQKAGTT